MTDYAACCIAATHSGAGKTTLTLGLLAALRRRGLRTQPFKCGPDYIDPGHHRRACGVISRNLDTWMMGEAGVRASYARAAATADVSVMEGVMGLFDGATPDRLDGSSAHVCKLLDIPVILTVDARAMARSIAPLVKGFAEFESGVRIVGVIANHVSTDSHAAILREALQAAQLPPLLGTLPRRPEWQIPERHLGLVAETESSGDASWFAALADGIEQHIDIDALLAACRTSRPARPDTAPTTPTQSPVRLGIARDAAFHFYYQDNLEMLQAAGIELVPFSPLTDPLLPADLDGLYIGGGFPEMFAETLSNNTTMRADIHAFARQGGSIYAECGGLMYLCEKLVDQDERTWAMCDVLPASTRMGGRRCRLGYATATTLQTGIFGPAGTALRGHEFHWSALTEDRRRHDPLFEVASARHTRHDRVGLQQDNVWASYLHVHFASNPAIPQAWGHALRQHREART